MLPFATKGLTTIDDPQQIGKVILIFEKHNKYPWLASLLSEQYGTDIDGYKLVERWYTDNKDKTSVYKYDDDTIKYHAVNPSIVEIKLLSSIHDNTPCTLFRYPSETDEKPTEDVIVEIRAELVTSLFADNIKIALQ